MSCTYSLTLQKILQDVLFVGGLDDGSCEGKRLGQGLTFLVCKIEGEVAYVDLALEGFGTVMSKVSGLATIETVIVALQGVDVHREALAAVHNSGTSLTVTGRGRGSGSECGCRFHRGTLRCVVGGGGLEMGEQLTCLPKTADFLDACDVGRVVGGVIARTVDGINDGFGRGHLAHPAHFLVVC